MGLARSCKSEVSTVISHTETQWENAIEKNRKYKTNVGSGSGLGLKK